MREALRIDRVDELRTALFDDFAIHKDVNFIDFELLGNVVKFYLGKDDLQEFYGDDWDDAPYDCNAGDVYDEFVSGVREIAFPSNWVLLEPKDDSRY